MAVYWFMYLIPAIMAIVHTPRRDGGYATVRWINPKTAMPSAWLLMAVFYIFLIGLRFEVGADWFNYLGQFEYVGTYDFLDVLLLGDPAYQLLNLICFKLGFGITGVNLISGSAFVFGLMMFCGICPRPWLGLAVSVPYFVIVVAMGYTRQSLAIGLVLYGLVLLGRQQFARFGLLILMASSFHRSAVVAGLAGLLFVGRRRLFAKLIVLLAVVVAFTVFVTGFMEVLYYNYVETLYESEGALFRVLMCVVPATIFLWKRRLFILNTVDRKLLTWSSVASLVTLVMVLLIPSTTFIDRFALYLLPVQIMVFSRLPDVFGKVGQPNHGVVVAILGYYALVLFVWLNYADHAEWWVPYKWVF